MGQTTTVLLVDDSQFLRVLNAEAFRFAGYDVITAEDGETALQLASSESPDIVVLDLQLPGLSGVEVLRHLKFDPVLRKIPVIVLSGLTRHNGSQLLLEGAAAYVEKNASSFGLLPEVVRDVLMRGMPINVAAQD